MKIAYLHDMVKGWFVGDFDPRILQSTDCEVGVKRYVAGTREAAHFHKIATEITVILNGRVRMNDKTYDDGSIILLEPGEVSDFEALTDVDTVVVKVPAAKDDKYLA